MKKQASLMAYSPLVVAISTVLSAGFSQSVMATDSFTQALVGGKPTVDINLRYESVNDKAKSGAAMTERTRIGYKTGDFKGVTGFVEMSGVESLGDRAGYHVGKGPYADGYATKSVIGDPVLTRLNQAWLGYKFANLDLKLGKQRIIMDTRFLGNVGWRQTEQVYTGLRVKAKPTKGVKLDYAYITESDNIFNVKTPMATHAFKADYLALPGLTVVGYGYLIDNANTAAGDSKTLGLRLKGGVSVSDGVKLIYQLEYAKQGDYADSKGVDASYRHIIIGAKLAGVVVAAAQEVLGGNGTYAFQTPLATKHIYNGWADKFLVTPKSGLIDNYLKVATKIKGAKLAGFYHNFSADSGGANLGSEVDVVLAKKFAKIYTAGIKYATYSGATSATDTNKLWIWGGIKF